MLCFEKLTKRSEDVLFVGVRRLMLFCSIVDCVGLSLCYAPFFYVLLTPHGFSRVLGGVRARVRA